MKVARVLLCENESCNNSFGGPGADDGFSEDWTETQIHDEALDLGWVCLEIMGEDRMFCSIKCVAKHIKDMA
jgi:hypothetical protein